MNNLLTQSSGEITSIFGPIELEISNNAVSTLARNQQIESEVFLRSKVSELHLVQEKETIDFDRSYSKTMVSFS